MTIYPVVHYKTGGMDPFHCGGVLCFSRAPVQRRINSRWPYMISLCNDGGWSLWQLKSLQILLELPEFCFFSSFFFFLNDCPRSGCRMHHHVVGPSLRVWVSFQDLCPKGKMGARKNPWLNLTRLCAPMTYLLLSGRLMVFEWFKSKKIFKFFSELI